MRTEEQWTELVREAYNEGFRDGEDQAFRYESGGYSMRVGECWPLSETKEELEKTEADRFMEQMEIASEIVATWPAWKRNLLDNSPSGEARKPC